MPITCQYRSKFAGFIFPIVFVAFLTSVIAAVWLAIGGGGDAALMLLSALTFMVFFAWMGFNLTTGFEFEVEHAQVLQVIMLGFWQRRTHFCRFDEVAAFTVKGIHNRARVQTWWEYQVAMLLKSGRLVGVAEATAKSVFESNRLAEKLAAVVGCEYFPGENQKTVQVAIAGAHPVFEYRDWNWSDVVSEFGLPTIASLIFFCAIVVFIVTLVVMLS
ncbi:MAG: hypothetical protein A2W80_15030 [Candidatus Riflebacteria bacterium GWC2_50_8]|nr:MAG: hypothetical protein A2W80_15030 [Candidatus Riflebacteria bacterium GWC2_50_8]